MLLKLLKMKKTLSLLLLFCLISCDFTSGLHREVLEAQKYIHNQDYEKAVNIYQQILDKNPSKQIKVKVTFQLAEIFFLYLNDSRKAIEHYNYVVHQADDPLWQVKSLEKVAQIQFHSDNNYKKSILSYEKLLSFKPRLNNSDEYEFNIAQAYVKLQKYDEAYKRFLNMAKDTTHRFYRESFFQLGMVDFLKQNWNTAIKNWFEYIKRIDDRDKITKTKFLIANAYESDEKLKKAYNVYYSLLEEHPNPEIIKRRLESLYERRVSRKR